jgi:hypothetical protein
MHGNFADLFSLLKLCDRFLQDRSVVEFYQEIAAKHKVVRSQKNQELVLSFLQS